MKKILSGLLIVLFFTGICFNDIRAQSGVLPNTGSGGGGGSGDFSDGGEAGGADRTLGNTDNYDLGFLTNNVNRLYIENGGNVGIGTTSPARTLHVENALSGDQEIIRVETADTSAGFGIDFSGAGSGVGLWLNTTRQFSVQSNGGVLIGNGIQGASPPR